MLQYHHQADEQQVEEEADFVTVHVPPPPISFPYSVIFPGPPGHKHKTAVPTNVPTSGATAKPIPEVPTATPTKAKPVPKPPTKGKPAPK